VMNDEKADSSPIGAALLNRKVTRQRSGLAPANAARPPAAMNDEKADSSPIGAALLNRKVTRQRSRADDALATAVTASAVAAALERAGVQAEASVPVHATTREDGTLAPSVRNETCEPAPRGQECVPALGCAPRALVAASGLWRSVAWRVVRPALLAVTVSAVLATAAVLLSARGASSRLAARSARAL